jgi:hypothetical protein
MMDKIRDGCTTKVRRIWRTEMNKDAVSIRPENRKIIGGPAPASRLNDEVGCFAFSEATRRGIRPSTGTVFRSRFYRAGKH